MLNTFWTITELHGQHSLRFLVLYPPPHPHRPTHSIAFPSFEQNGEGTGVISRSSGGGMVPARLLSLTQKHMVCHRAAEVRPSGGAWDHFCLCVCVLKGTPCVNSGRSER